MSDMGTINTQISQETEILLIPTCMGINYTMTNNNEQREKERRAERLTLARIRADVGGAKAASDKFGWNVNNYKAHESGRNGFGIADAKKYAKAYNVSVSWLNFGIGSPDDHFSDTDELKLEAINLFDSLSPSLQEAAIQNLKILASLNEKHNDEEPQVKVDRAKK
ncbi:helix-turn-helix domain-containing protein [Pseudochrobactrum sp. HB0163]|uniref:helix-turn-helix domain-containing protein n=1 Tax=Pseudochrobactrum sp. HB0163 TaxID=3450708 RepID=UPI003F6DF9F6